MVSHRNRKKAAQSLGLTPRELELAELVEELLESVRWLWILGYSNQYLMSRYLRVPTEERDKILEAATRAVDKDRRLGDWQERLGRLKGEVTHIKRAVNRARRDVAQGRAAPDDPFGRAGPGREGDAD